jgi:hypothetical protein
MLSIPILDAPAGSARGGLPWSAPNKRCVHARLTEKNNLQMSEMAEMMPEHVTRAKLVSRLFPICHG